MTVELKPCPFCGAAMDDYFHGHGFTHPLVADRNEACILSGLGFSYVHSRWGTDERARWNRRADLPRPEDAARIAELEAKNSALVRSQQCAEDNLAKACAAWPAVLKIIREYGEAFPYAEMPDDDDAVSRLNAALERSRQ